MGKQQNADDLILYLLNWDDNSSEEMDINEMDDGLIEKYGIGEKDPCEVFEGIANDLLSLIEVGESPMTEKLYKGFADIKKGVWLMKKEVDIDNE